MKILAVLFSIFIIVVIILADLGSLGFLKRLYDFPYGDKLGHFTLYGILSFLILFAVLRSCQYTDSRRAAVYIPFILALLITTEEVSQVFIANRTFSLLDLAFSCAGTFLGAWLAWKIAGKSR